MMRPPRPQDAGNKPLSEQKTDFTAEGAPPPEPAGGTPAAPWPAEGLDLPEPSRPSILHPVVRRRLTPF